MGESAGSRVQRPGKASGFLSMGEWQKAEKFWVKSPTGVELTEFTRSDNGKNNRQRKRLASGIC